MDSENDELLAQITKKWSFTWFQAMTNSGFMEEPLFWEFISQNPNITMDIIQANPDKPWDWKGFSEHITWVSDSL